MADDTTTWALIHAERAALVDLLETLTPQQWEAPSLCGNWSVRTAAAHILAGAEQTPLNFTRRMAANAFRFNVMIERDAQKFGRLTAEQITQRLRMRTSTTNHPPAPIMAMLGEVVVHGADIKSPLGVVDRTAPEASVACLEMYRSANFPVGGRKRIEGLRLHATDVGWTHGSGPDVCGPAASMLLAMTGRKAGLAELSGDGVALMAGRFSG